LICPQECNCSSYATALITRREYGKKLHSFPSGFTTDNKEEEIIFIKALHEKPFLRFRV
jgi:hypothetical protein